jgi:cytochrome c oxidase assembly protein subunit 11
MGTEPQTSPTRPGIRRTALACAGLALGMVGLAYASVPLYDLFCRVTGFDGRPLIGSAPSAKVLDRAVAVRFDANVAPGLNWRFTPESPEVAAKLGETTTVMYRTANEGASETTGIASFNVQPALAAAYFVKIQCFCFTEQTLPPGQASESAVVFYVDPAIAEDPNLKGLSAITLSYTYFPAKQGKSLADAATSARLKLQ